MQAALLQQLHALPIDRRETLMRGLSPEVARSLRFAWRALWARPDQLPPGSLGAAPAIRGRPGLVDLFRQKTPPAPEHFSDWSTWVMLGGRGSGKTCGGSETVIGWAKRGPQPPIALVGATAADVRDVMVCANPQSGQSGIIARSEPGFVPRWEPSKRKLSWPNGVVALGFSAEEPERLRGPQFGKAWADDVAAWSSTTRDGAWDMLQFGLRLGDRPQCVVTTTPKPVPWLIGSRTGSNRGILNDPTTAITRARTADNRVNLAASFLTRVVAKYEGTRLGRQELEAELLTDIEGALWSLAMFDATAFRIAGRAHEDVKSALEAVGVESYRRVVTAIDPQASDGTGDTESPEGPETGIITAAVAECRCKGDDKPEDHGFVIEDNSGNFSPNDWATEAINAHERHHADRIIGEKNNGGAMVENTIRTVSRNVSYSSVWASRGKRTRAEPVSSLYEQGKVHHVGAPEKFALLEDQLTTWNGAGNSPNRLDAAVWALSELMITGEESTADIYLRAKFGG